MPDSVLEGEKFILLPDEPSHHHDYCIFTAPPVSVWPNPHSQHLLGRHMSSSLTASFTFNSTPNESTRALTVLSNLETHEGFDHAHQNNEIFQQMQLSSQTNSLDSFVCDTTRKEVPYPYGSLPVSLQISSSLPAPPPDFEGREVDMYRTITTLLARRLVTLVGDDGIGKSTIAAAVCSYMADRWMFEDGVVYVRAQGAISHLSFLEMLQHSILSGPIKLAHRLHRLLGTKLDVVDELSLSSNSGGSEASLYRLEETLVSCLSSMKLLLVIDNLDSLLSAFPANSNNSLSYVNDTTTDLKLFLGRLFERSKYIKILLTSTETLAVRGVSGFGVVENCISIGRLNLRSSLRLFAKLAPPLMTAASKTAFINSLLPPRHGNVTINSSELDATSAQILGLLGDGHPAKIVKLACQSTQESIDILQSKGVGIIENFGVH